MASENTAPTPAGTHKDPVTGEMISKQSVVFAPFFFSRWSMDHDLKGTQASRKTKN